MSRRARRTRAIRDNDRSGGVQPRVAVPRQAVYAFRPRLESESTTATDVQLAPERLPRVLQPRYRNYYNYYRYYARPYYYYPYAFGYGPHGRGYFYFDLHYNSYVFYPPTVVRYDNYGTYYGTYGYPTGELRLQVRPRDAQVFIDGSYAGTVDDFDGTFQSLRLEEGEYRWNSCCQATSRSISTFGSCRARRSRIKAT